MDQKRSKNLKRVVSGLLSLAMITTSMSAVLPASADAASKQEAYPYAIFAADELGGIKLDLNYLTVNGNTCTNGVYSTTAKYPNVNGTILENEALAVDEIVTDDENTTDAQDGAKAFDVSRDMIYIHNKLMTSWFNNSRNFDNDYTLSEMNINLNSPVYVTGKMSYNGNVALNTAIGAVSDVTLSGGNLNGNNAVIYSKFGDINIDESQASMNGLIYAPFGTVTIDCDNFNLNGIIIAQNVVINSRYGANINYSNTWAEFVGTETEELSWTFADWKYLADTDKDGLPNLIEKEIGTKPYEADTDGDLLPDGYEVLSLGTDPLKIDTNDNGVSDYDEDFDTDGLSNGQEYEIGTRPFNDDSDGDNLKDGDEVNTYFTDPLEVDTDKDGLNDDDEIYFGTDPKDPDSDDDGELDGKERRSQTFTHKVENEDCAVTEVIVSMEGTGNLQKTTTVESVMNKDMLCTGVVGLVGEPFSIETTSKYEKATLTYVIDKSKLGDTEFDNLLFLWYDENKDEFVELETILDEENSTVSINTTHFSKYMLVDKKEWFDAWKRASLYFEDDYEPLAAAICYDCSGSMSGNDRNGYRKLAIDNFIDSMTLTDKTALISFESSAKLVSGFSYDKEELKRRVEPYNGGGTNVRSAIEEAVKQLSKVEHWYTRHIILLSDGDVNLKIDLSKNVVDDLIKQAAEKNIKIHTIGLGSDADNQKLKDCATYTGGDSFTAATAEELDAIYKDLSKKNHFDLKTLPDKDKDGLPDEFEVSGLVISNAQIFYTDPEIQDCDNDDLFDGQEISIDNIRSKVVEVYDGYSGKTTYSSVYFTYNSDPWDDDTYKNGHDDLWLSEYDRNFNTLIEKIKILEDDIREIKNSELIYDHEYYEMFDDSIITINVLRCLKKRYGYDGIINNLMWSYATGFDCGELREEIEKRHHGLLGYFQNLKFIDRDGNEIDFIHMMATLSGYRNEPLFVDVQLSGWAGDLQTLIYDIKVHANEENSNLNEVAKKYICSDESEYFKEDDMFSDIDADNIVHLYNQSELLSDVLKDYYNNVYKDRFKIFVDNYGGIEKLKEKADEFTHGNGPVKHYFMKDKAEEAAYTPKIRKKYEESFEGYKYYTSSDMFGNPLTYSVPIYSIPDPKIITQEESDALTYAFINYIKGKL